MEGTASSQVITHYLKLGSTRERLEKELMEKQKELMSVKAENIRSNLNMDEMYAKAIEAMRSYSGHANETNDQDVL